MHQVHSDWHLGIRAAIAAHFPEARFIGDWSHFCGSVRRKGLQGSSPEEVNITRWRTGVFVNLRQELRDKELLQDLERFIHTARLLPQAIFSLLIDEVLAWLENRGELESILLLKRTYLSRCVNWQNYVFSFFIFSVLISPKIQNYLCVEAA